MGTRSSFLTVLLLLYGLGSTGYGARLDIDCLDAGIAASLNNAHDFEHDRPSTLLEAKLSALLNASKRWNDVEPPDSFAKYINQSGQIARLGKKWASPPLQVSGPPYRVGAELYVDYLPADSKSRVLSRMPLNELIRLLTPEVMSEPREVLGKFVVLPKPTKRSKKILDLYEVESVDPEKKEFRLRARDGSESSMPIAEVLRYNFDPPTNEIYVARKIWEFGGKGELVSVKDPNPRDRRTYFRLTALPAEIQPDASHVISLFHDQEGLDLLRKALADGTPIFIKGDGFVAQAAVHPKGSHFMGFAHNRLGVERVSGLVIAHYTNRYTLLHELTHVEDNKSHWLYEVIDRISYLSNQRKSGLTQEDRDELISFLMEQRAYSREISRLKQDASPMGPSKAKTEMWDDIKDDVEFVTKQKTPPIRDMLSRLAGQNPGARKEILDFFRKYCAPSEDIGLPVLFPELFP